MTPPTTAAGSGAHAARPDPPPAPAAGITTGADGDAEALARATWSRLAEPADAHACALVGRLGATAALDWLTHEALDAEGAPRPAPAHRCRPAGTSLAPAPTGPPPPPVGRRACKDSTSAANWMCWNDSAAAC
ncbi:hypothetical protein [Actinomyces procaprae]|uniref:hypothetical protein n=1 Tax=Actinomyces procaprae TaxID=2560010 RepID=UPI003B835A2D